ncbi:MAG: B12-binding domain-containing radical SAM protein, partial [Promethearchaeota archaeon]
MNILLIEQLRISTTSYKPFEKFLLTSFSILPTLYIRRLAAITPKHHKITLINERYVPICYSNSYDLVVIHFDIGATFRAYEIADHFQSLKVTVVLCGLHASSLPDEGLKHANSVLIGRGEVNWITLLNDAENNTLKRIYPPEPFENLKGPIPPVNVDLPGFQIMGAIEATRGCPYKCHYCPESNTPDGSLFYKRPINEIIDELKIIPQKIVMFYDTSLTIDPLYTKKLFKEMMPLKKKFFCNGNIDVLSTDEELVRLSKKAGCIGWLIGFESISQETIDLVQKKTNIISAYEKAINCIHSHKMMVIGDFMFGFDTDNKDVFITTIQKIHEMGIDVADFTIATPFPGTPFF